MASAEESWTHGLLRLLGTLLAIAILAWTFHSADPDSVARILGRSGASVWLVLVPFAVAQLFETAAWQASFRALGHRLALGPLLGIRLGCEALTQTLPLGIVIAETVKPALLSRRCGLGTPEALAGMAARKYLLIVAQVPYFVGAVLLGASALHAASIAMTGGAYLDVAAVGVVVVLVTLALGMELMLGRGRIATRILDALRAVPIRWLQRALDRNRGGFSATDRHLAHLFALPWRRWVGATGLFFVAWCCEAAETAVLLHVLGVQLDLEAIVVMEVCVSFLRHIAFVLPAGLGVQDFGYVTFLAALGVPDALNVGAAFVLLKRGKELFWSIVGFGCLLGARAAKRVVPVAAE
jgi:uncharacterized membrane protein YbhN (UPF0104 family)